MLCPWDGRQIWPLVDVYGESGINGKSSKHILLCILSSLPYPVIPVVPLWSEWWDAGGTENGLQIVSIHIQVIFIHSSMAVNKENWLILLNINLVVWTQTAGEGTGLYALFCVVAVRLHSWAVNSWCLSVFYIKYCTSKFSCYGSYLVGWLLFFRWTPSVSL